MGLKRYETQVGLWTILTKTPEGKLEIKLTRDGREEIDEFQQKAAQMGSTALFLDMIADHLECGWETVRPEEIGALTDALILSDSVRRDDNGNLESVRRVYWDSRYAVRDPIDELAREGFIEFDGQS